MSKYLGLDLGGTNIKVAVIEKKDNQWNVIKKEDHSTEAEGGPAHVVGRLAKLASENLTEFPDLAGVGVAVPGIFNASDGTIELFPNLPGPWKGFQALAPIADAVKIPTALVNDARAFTLAESIMGAAHGKKTVVCYVIGTGVGGGIVIDGKIHMGATGGAGEVAHQIVKPNGPLCGCGGRGCAENLTN
jgi:glucokinase